MESENPPAVPFMSPWIERLAAALEQTQRSLLLVSPYIKADALRAIERALAGQAGERSLSIRVLTHVRTDDLLAGASDIAALERIVNWPATYPKWTVELRRLENVHAKVWVIDDRVALVGSGNATAPGLEGNVEYGVELRDVNTVAQILAEWRAPWERAGLVPSETLSRLHQALESAASDKSLRDAQELLDKRRSELLGDAGAPFSLGDAFPIARSGLLSMPAPTPSPALLTGQHSHSATSHEAKGHDPCLDGFALELRHDLLWKAIKWLVPGAVGVSGFAPQLTPSSLLQIICEPWEPYNRAQDDRSLVSRIDLVWADSRREMVATIPASVRCSEERFTEAQQAAVRGPWAITLDMRAIQRLIEALNTYGPYSQFNLQRYTEVRLRTQPPYTSLTVEGWRVMRLENGMEDDVIINSPTSIPVAPASPAPERMSTFEPVLEGGLAHVDLVNALAYFDTVVTTPARAMSRSSHPTARSAIIDMRLKPNPGPQTYFELSLEGHPRSEKIDVEIVIDKLKGHARYTSNYRLDTAAFDQMLNLDDDGEVRPTSWRVSAPASADFMQFAAQAFSHDQLASLTYWYCRLRSIEE